jgi:type I restriction enzyme R subunit
MRPTEADTCRKYVLPKLYAANWSDDQISEQKTFTDGRIVVAGAKVRRRPQKRADYLLRYTRDFMLAVVEAKASYKKPGDGLQQAKEYAQILGLKFAYATNGHGIVEHDFLTGKDTDLDAFPAPLALWRRLRKGEGIETKEAADRLLTPYHHLSGKIPRYYQEIAINRTVQAVLQGKPRILLTMATGTGKTLEQPLESDGRVSPSQDPLPGGSKHPGGRPKRQRLPALRRRPLEDRGRGGQGARDVLCHLPGHRQG